MLCPGAGGWRLRIVRNLMQGLAELLPAVALVILGFVSDQVLGVALLTIATGALGFCTAGATHSQLVPYMFISSFCGCYTPGLYLTNVVDGRVREQLHGHQSLLRRDSDVAQQLLRNSSRGSLALSDGSHSGQKRRRQKQRIGCRVRLDSNSVLSLPRDCGVPVAARELRDCAGRWRVVFYIAAAIYVVGYIVYFFGVRVEPLPELENLRPGEPPEEGSTAIAPLLSHNGSKREDEE